MEKTKQNKIILLRQMIENAERNITAAKQILLQLDGDNMKKSSKELEASQIVEGTFDGEKMVGLDGKTYPVPPNYASKSKLVEGDLLKLTITEDGTFLYKQISPIDRRKLIGTIITDNKGKFYVYSEGKKYKVLLASLTYFKAKEGDEVTLVVPKEKISKWAAIEAALDVSENKGTDSDDSENKPTKELDNEEGNEKEDVYQENKKEKIEDEWIPDIEDIRGEAIFKKDRDAGISDDLLRE